MDEGRVEGDDPPRLGVGDDVGADPQGGELVGGQDQHRSVADLGVLGGRDVVRDHDRGREAEPTRGEPGGGRPDGARDRLARQGRLGPLDLFIRHSPPTLTHARRSIPAGGRPRPQKLRGGPRAGKTLPRAARRSYLRQRPMVEPFVSAIIPTYNRAREVVLAVESVLGQRYPEDRREILVVDDGSKDDGATLEALRPYGDRIRYMRKENGGVSSARNYGMAHARGDSGVPRLRRRVDAREAAPPGRLPGQPPALRPRHLRLRPHRRAPAPGPHLLPRRSLPRRLPQLHPGPCASRACRRRRWWCARRSSTRLAGSTPRCGRPRTSTFTCGPRAGSGRGS